MIDLRREGPVFVLAMVAGENRFHGRFVAAFHRALDQVERAGSPAALVTTGAEKFYSNGLDLDWLAEAGPAAARERLAESLGLLARVLAFPVYTVAAVNGHAFGAGALLAVAHDARLMRADRGYFCMPEIDMQVPLHPGMVALLQARLPLETAHRVVVTGTRFGGEAACAAGIVERAVPADELLAAAIETAAGMAPKAHPVMARLKRSLYPRALEALASMPDDILAP